MITNHPNGPIPVPTGPTPAPHPPLALPLPPTPHWPYSHPPPPTGPTPAPHPPLALLPPPTPHWPHPRPPLCPLAPCAFHDDDTGHGDSWSCRVPPVFELILHQMTPTSGKVTGEGWHVPLCFSHSIGSFWWIELQHLLISSNSMVFNLFISRVLKLCPWVEVVSVLTDCLLAAFSLAVGGRGKLPWVGEGSVLTCSLSVIWHGSRTSFLKHSQWESCIVLWKRVMTEKYAFILKISFKGSKTCRGPLFPRCNAKVNWRDNYVLLFVFCCVNSNW